MTIRASQLAQVGRFIGSPTTLALGITTARTAALKPWTTYRLWPSVDAFFKFGDGTVVATLTDNPLTAKLDTLHVTNDTELFCAGIVSSGTGTLFLSEEDTDK